MTNEIVSPLQRWLSNSPRQAVSLKTRHDRRQKSRSGPVPGTDQSVIRPCMLKLKYCIRAYAHFQSPPSTFDGHKFNNTVDVNRTVVSLLIDDSDEERGRRSLAKDHSLSPSSSHLRAPPDRILRVQPSRWPRGRGSLTVEKIWNGKSWKLPDRRNRNEFFAKKSYTKNKT